MGGLQAGCQEGLKGDWAHVGDAGERGVKLAGWLAGSPDVGACNDAVDDNATGLHSRRSMPAAGLNAPPLACKLAAAECSTSQLARSPSQRAHKHHPL